MDILSMFSGNWSFWSVIPQNMGSFAKDHLNSNSPGGTQSPGLLFVCFDITERLSGYNIFKF